jgi:hypothetical protein
MREIDLTKLLPDIILRFQREHKSEPVPVFLTLPYNLPNFPWNDRSLEDLIFRLVNHAISTSNPERHVRVAIAKRGTLSDLEALAEIHPFCWIQLRIEMQSLSGIGTDLQEKFGDLGFSRKDDWATGNSSLIAYSRPNRLEPQLIFWMQDRKATHRYALLIPIMN